MLNHGQMGEMPYGNELDSRGVATPSMVRQLFKYAQKLLDSPPERCSVSEQPAIRERWNDAGDIAKKYTLSISRVGLRRCGVYPATSLTVAYREPNSYRLAGYDPDGMPVIGRLDEPGAMAVWTHQPPSDRTPELDGAVIFEYPDTKELTGRTLKSPTIEFGYVDARAGLSADACERLVDTVLKVGYAPKRNPFDVWRLYS